MSRGKGVGKRLEWASSALGSYADREGGDGADNGSWTMDRRSGNRSKVGMFRINVCPAWAAHHQKRWQQGAPTVSTLKTLLSETLNDCVRELRKRNKSTIKDFEF